MRAPFRLPAPELSPDLDLRPGEPTRSTLGRWVARCRGCGAAAPDLPSLPGFLAEVVAGPAYQAVEGPAPSLRFQRWALLCESLGDAAGRRDALLQAAWSVDDLVDAGDGGQAQAARALRLRAAACWGSPALDDPGGVQDALRLVDVWRRAGAFEQATEAAEALLGAGVESVSEAVARFQMQRAAAGDAGRHLMSTALPPPARRRHAPAAPAAARSVRAQGFWARLLRRGP